MKQMLRSIACACYGHESESWVDEHGTDATWLLSPDYHGLEMSTKYYFNSIFTFFEVIIIIVYRKWNLDPRVIPRDGLISKMIMPCLLPWNTPQPQYLSISSMDSCTFFSNSEYNVLPWHFDQHPGRLLCFFLSILKFFLFKYYF